MIIDHTTTKPRWNRFYRGARIARKVIAASSKAVKMHTRMVQAYEECGFTMQVIPLNVPAEDLYRLPRVTIYGRVVLEDNALPMGQIVAA